MSQNGFATGFLQILLGWLQSLFNGLWALFSGGSGGSVIRWFSDNWLSLLLTLLVLGIVMDVVIYLIRWRPFWWWFRKKRIIIDDEIYDDYVDRRVKTKDGKTVHPSTIVKRRKPDSDYDDFDEDDDVFKVKKKKSRDPFEVEYSVRRTPKVAGRTSDARRRSVR